MNKHVTSPFTLADLHSPPPRGTALSTAFAALLPVLAEYVRAERDLEDIGFSLDPAYGNWNKAAEDAQDRLIDALHTLRILPLEMAADLPLRRMVLTLHAMRYEGGSVARRLHRRMEEAFDGKFRLPGTSPTAQHRSLLLTWARPLIADFIALPIFDPEPEDGLALEEPTDPIA